MKSTRKQNPTRSRELKTTTESEGGTLKNKKPKTTQQANTNTGKEKLKAKNNPTSQLRNTKRNPNQARVIQEHTFKIKEKGHPKGTDMSTN